MTHKRCAQLAVLLASALLALPAGADAPTLKVTDQITDATVLASEAGSFHTLTWGGLVIERPVLPSPARPGRPAFAKLPSAVLSLLGPNTVEYESFSVTRLPPHADQALRALLA